jgi:hypothetical protein
MFVHGYSYAQKCVCVCVWGGGGENSLNRIILTAMCGNNTHVWPYRLQVSHLCVYNDSTATPIIFQTSFPSSSLPQSPSHPRLHIFPRIYRRRKTRYEVARPGRRENYSDSTLRGIDTYFTSNRAAIDRTATAGTARVQHNFPLFLSLTTHCTHYPPDATETNRGWMARAFTCATESSPRTPKALHIMYVLFA